MRKVIAEVVVALVVAFALIVTATAYAGSYGGSSISSSAGRSSSYSSSSSSSRPSSSSSSSTSSRSSSYSPSRSSSSSSTRSYGGVRTPSARQPSSGKVTQPAPVSRLVPPKLAPNIRPPVGRNFTRDVTVIRSRPAYFDPYNSLYYGNPASPYYYLYLDSIANGQHPVAYQQASCHGGGVGVGWLVFGIIAGLAAGAILGAFAVVATGSRSW